MRLRWVVFVAVPVVLGCVVGCAENNASNAAVAELIDDALEPGSAPETPFREVVEAVTGTRVLPIDPAAEIDQAILAEVTAAVRGAIEEFNRPNSPTSSEGRINEVSRHFERALQERLDGTDGFRCESPRTAEGNQLSAGYPDLRLVHEASGRVVYVDPKLVAAGTFDGSLRTFYYSPNPDTSKVLDDAHHLLIGIEHDGATGAWKFTGWKLVDLYGLNVRLKAEFQAGNRDVYQDRMILDEG